MPEWFKHWFGEDYLRVYYHRDRQEAGRFVETILEECPVPRDGLVLDVACGLGRHALTFAELGFRVLGVDLSMPLLQKGNEILDEVRDEAASGGRPIPAMLLVRADMRDLPLSTSSGRFHLVVNLFTAFGYFPTEEDDARSLHMMTRCLLPGGHLVLDFLNRRRLEDDMVPEDTEYREGLLIRQERRFADLRRRVEKTITLEHADGRVETFRESVRLYAPDDLRRLALHAGLEPLDWWGDYAGQPFADDSDRCILIARRPVS